MREVEKKVREYYGLQPDPLAAEESEKSAKSARKTMTEEEV